MMASGTTVQRMPLAGFVSYSSAANLPAAKVTVGGRTIEASGSIMAVGLTSQSKKDAVMGIATGTEIAIVTMIHIAATAMAMAKDKWSHAHRTTCIGTIARPTRAAGWN
jgi:hypothetical protein